MLRENPFNQEQFENESTSLTQVDPQYVLDPYLASLTDLSGLRMLEDTTPPDFNFDPSVPVITNITAITNTSSSKNVTSYTVMKQPQYEGSVQVFSAQGAIVACVTISLLAFVAYFAYKVYYQGEVFFIDPQAANKATNEVIVDEQKVAGNPKLNKKPSNKEDQQQPVDVGAIDLELFDGNADNIPTGPPKPAAKGGMSGVAFDRAVREQLNQKKLQQQPQRRQPDIESDEHEEVQQPPARASNQRSQPQNLPVNNAKAALPKSNQYASNQSQQAAAQMKMKQQQQQQSESEESEELPEDQSAAGDDENDGSYPQVAAAGTTSAPNSQKLHISAQGSNQASKTPSNHNSVASKKEQEKNGAPAVEYEYYDEEEEGEGHDGLETEAQAKYKVQQNRLNIANKLTI